MKGTHFKTQHDKGAAPMRHNTSLPRRAAAFFLAVLLLIPAAFAAAGEQVLQTSTQITDGLIYRNTITVNQDSRVESFSLELSPDSQVYPILVQGDVTIYGGANITKAIANTQARGYHVLAAVNADFFSMSTGVPMGLVVEDGIYKSSTDSENAVAITDGRVSVVESPRVAMTVRNEASGFSISPFNFNKARHDFGGIYLLNSYFSDISTHSAGAGWYIRMKAAADPATGLIPELTVNSTLTLEVTELIESDQSITIGPGEYILTAADAAGWSSAFHAFQVGDSVTLTTTCDYPDLSSAQWVCGAGDIMLKDGVMTDSSSWVYASDGRQPRTALGVKADGTLVLYAVDGRQSGYSIGLSQKNLADELLRQGCVTAVNLDGGGSTSLSVWIPGQAGPAMRNSPSGGTARRCATYLMLVTPQRGSGQASRLAPDTDPPVVLSGSSVPLPQVKALDDGLNLVEANLSGLTYTSLEGLGHISGESYTAGSAFGTDTLLLSAGGLTGTAQIHVVDTLTELKVTRTDTGSPLNSLTLRPEEQVQLAVSGSYWGRNALRDLAPVVFAVQGNVGTIDETGLFTASRTPGDGAITISAGGLTHTVNVTTTNVHQDVPEDHWAYPAVEYCYEKGIVSGISPTLFGRDLPISRADFMVMLHNAMGQPEGAAPCTFTDVSPSSYYYPALSWAQHLGLAAGVGGSRYAPTDNITREQAFALLYRFLPIAGKQCPDGSLTALDKFSDSAQIAAYAQTAAATLVEQGLVSGTGAGLTPQGTLTRAEMAVMLRQVLEHTPVTPPTGPGEPTDPAGPGEPTDPAGPTDPVNPVDPAGHKLALDQSRLTLPSGGSATLSASILPAVDGAEITWSSSDPAAAAVSSTGMVTNLYPGVSDKTVTITASWNGLSASCAVTCQKARRIGTVTGTETGLNVRSGPGTGYSPIGGLWDGNQVIVLGEEPGWYQILFRNPSGQAAIGYVTAEYLSVEG